MKEYQDDAEGTDVANGEEVYAIEAEVRGIYQPTNRQASIPPKGSMKLAVNWSQKSMSDNPMTSILMAPTDHEHSRQSTPASTVTTHAAYFRGIRNSSEKKAVPISCMEMVDVKAANTNRA